VQHWKVNSIHYGNKLNKLYPGRLKEGLSNRAEMKTLKLVPVMAIIWILRRLDSAGVEQGQGSDSPARLWQIEQGHPQAG
jgi:hypothetical protein